MVRKDRPTRSATSPMCMVGSGITHNLRSRSPGRPNGLVTRRSAYALDGAGPTRCRVRAAIDSDSPGSPAVPGSRSARGTEVLRPVRAVFRVYPFGVSDAQLGVPAVQDVGLVPRAVHPLVHDRSRGGRPGRDVLG